MKAVKTFLFLAAACFSFTGSYSQQQTDFASQQAILFADSLVKTFRSNNFDEYIHRTRSFSNTDSPENLELIQILHNVNEWQCVVRKTSLSVIDGKKAQ